MVPAWSDPDDAPDLATEEWLGVFDAAPVIRGRPKSPSPKVATTLRLDPDIVAHFRASGPGWQTRINETLRRAAGLGEKS
ncbi:BrnA antitoxin family protein [Palleronia caenipelagi]|uniref:BrnA antitoxin family protein n=1 Tax=Palleronia caenipelagi TaxID=2489174 RepID=A0A547PMS6_9RHOB|nr:BrnA antitoxin family protein [Palleronia caenipelagi]TRD15450.1 BrnA antitoxin family protein [Palleronia caenipelagi]